MPAIKMPYGKTAFDLNLDDSQIMTVVEANKLDIPKMSQQEAVREALAHPIDSGTLGEILKPGEKVCLIAPDITRLWESTFVSTPILLDAMNKAGVKDEDITILCACGTHRPMTAEEHKELLGEETVKRVKVIDHQCEDRANLKFMGKTSRGTPVYFNKHACEADKIITSCGIVYHFFAGFGGGAKMLLPGISGYETIMHNHGMTLNPGHGSGENPNACAGNISPTNPVHADMVEAASMLPPCFSLNVVVDDKFHIIKAFAGQWEKSHREGCELVGEMDGVKIPEKSNFVIASAGGYPKDISLYQGVKLVSNALAAAKPGATVVLLAKFPEKFGNEDTRRLIQDYSDMRAREEALREDFSIGAFGGYFFSQACRDYNIILVSDMEETDFGNIGVKAVKSLDEALDLAKKGVKPGAKAIVMPHGATTLPITPK